MTQTALRPEAGSRPVTLARLGRWGPSVVTAAVTAVNLWSLRATLTPVAYLDDASIHEQMVRYATGAFQAGRSPLSGWFPYLGLGSPQFLHYQSLGAMITGLAGTVVGADTAFRWSLWLLLGLWPVVIYASARIFRLSPWTAAAAALVSPLLRSVPSVGFERGAYVWIGYGLWSQLWGMTALPLAWATTWRAVANRRFIAPAAICVTLTVELHFETGYLALLGVVVFPWLVRTDLRQRVARAATLLGCTVLLSACITIPLLVYSKWAGINETLIGTSLENGYGAGTVLHWLWTGRVFDNGRVAAFSVAVLVGAIACILRWRRDQTGRALIVMGVLALIICFGRTTFGPLVDIVPASHDVFFRRFMMGTQLAGIFLAGIGIVFVAKAIAALIARVASGTTLRATTVQGASAVAAAVICWPALLPAIDKIADYDRSNQKAINEQHAEQTVQGAQIAPLIRYIKAHPGGRTYAGMPSNWGSRFTVGAVPVFKYLESQDVDEVGYTLRTASLMTTPEYAFEDNNPSEYTVFGIRYLIAPQDHRVPAGAQLVTSSAQYKLWVLPDNGYLDVIDTIGTVRADRGHLTGVDPTGLVGPDADLTVAWAGASAAKPTNPSGIPPKTPSGGVLSEQPHLVRGRASAVVHLQRTAVVLLSASYDPGWRVTVDGRRERTEMLAPALVGVTVGPGTHDIAFSYHGYPHYTVLVIAGLAGLGLALVVSSRRLSSFVFTNVRSRFHS